MVDEKIKAVATFYMTIAEPLNPAMTRGFD